MARKTISIDQLDGFSVDEETNQLFWQGKSVMTVTSLPWWVQVSALGAGCGTMISAMVAVIRLFT